VSAGATWRWALAVCLVAVAALAGGCGGGEEEPLTVFAAASLTDVLPAVEPAARYSFAGSNTLALQIEQGAPADVFVSASPRYTQELLEQGLVDEPVAIASNALVVVLAAGNPAGVEDLADLARPGVRVVLAAPEVPAGAIAREALETGGRADVLANVVSEEPDVRGVLAKVTTGEADAGFVYATDARTVPELEAIPLAEAQPARYEAAVVTASPHAEAARAFVELLVSEQGAEALARAGFGPP
jgi:molybdate transport system substrate-binding protein